LQISSVNILVCLVKHIIPAKIVVSVLLAHVSIAKLIKPYFCVMGGKVTAVILAGGKSSRMGTDKSMLPVNGRPLIAHIADQLRGNFDEVIIGANDPEKYAFTGLPVIPDIVKDKGPLMGIYSCLKASKNDVNFVTACDIPVINIQLIDKMRLMATDADVVMPVTADGQFEPLFAVYRKSVVPHAEALLLNNIRKLTSLLDVVKVSFVELDDSSWYNNLNFRTDYHEFIKNYNTTD
jgi:molybdenum cofactor guanylyltransferase